MKTNLYSMKKTIIVLAALLAALPAFAQKMEPWQDPEIIEENRMPMRATFVTDQQQTLSLNGVWKFNWNETIEGRTRGFEAKGYDDSSWGKMPVPGMWELNGYGEPMYLNAGYPWREHYTNNPPYPPTERNYVGQYRKTFTIDNSWIGKQICLCIGSATSNVRVWVNGRMVGYSEDSKLEARFDITGYVKPGENLIALEIFRWCDGTYLEDQDFNRFGGIARGVFVYTREKERIEDIHIVAGMDGGFSVSAEVTSGVREFNVKILDPAGRAVASGSSVPAKGKVSFSGSVASPELWSAEKPALYTLEVSALGRKGLLESTSLQFGFRTIEIRNAQLLVNGQPVLIKGVDRHEMNPDKGYVVSEADMINDIRIMKELNVNAVRTCHYPDDPMWLTLCDRYGIYVVDEANVESHGMGYGEESLAHRSDYRKAHLARNSRMVQRDFNHPSVIVWSLGNEAGNGENFYACYDWIKAYDTSRPVQYERAEDGRNTDIRCPMYWGPDACERYSSNNPDRPLIQCEYAHAMGNSMGNFKEYWDLVRKYPSFQGGFIWDFVDQALRWPSDDGGTDHIFAFGGDFNDYDPSDGSFNCNGVVSSDRKLHPHAYEVRYQYRNILTTSADPRSGRINILNENFFKDLSQYRLVWSISEDGRVVCTGIVENLDCQPQKTLSVSLGLPEMDVDDKDVLLNVSYVLKSEDGLLPAGTEVAYDQFTVSRRTSPVFAAGSASVSGQGISCADAGGRHVFSGLFRFAGVYSDRIDEWEASFDKKTGFLCSYRIGGKEMLSEPLVPEFSRAPVENDLGARLQDNRRQGVWRYPEFRLESMDVGLDGECWKVEASYAPIANGAAVVKMSYVLHPDGTIEGNEKMTDAGSLSKAPDLFRFGMKFAMPGRYSKIDFFGKGPWENYCDRNSAALTGRYIQSVNDQYHYGYVRTQESGTHTDLSFLRVTDENGTGLEITSGVKFSASALPFLIRDLDCAADADPEKKHHSLSLKALAHENDRSNGMTYINFDLKQMGVGGIQSWGALPLEEYRIHAAERDFSFIIRPIDN